MKISTKGRYALRMLSQLAKADSEEYISLTEIANTQGISKKYLEQIVPVLSRAGLVQTAHGHTGGYRLNRLPIEITISEVLELTEGNLSCVKCLQTPENTCDRKDSCPTLPLWEKMNRVIWDYLDSVTVQDLINKTL